MTTSGQSTPATRGLTKPGTSGVSTPSSSGRSTPANVRLSGDFGCLDGPTPSKQKRLSASLNFEDLVLKEEPLHADEVSSDFEEGEGEVEPVGASQYGDLELVDPEVGGLLIGFAYLPSEVTLPNLVPVRPGLEEVELTPCKYSNFLF